MTQTHRSGSLPTPTPESGATHLRSHSQADEPFPDAADDFGLKPRPKPRRTDPLINSDLGGIRIIRLLGEGGMGRVYEARQENPSRTVAVKVIRQGIASEKTMRRFEREAEFLGRLQHPCIAQIFVVGSYSSDEGDVPFFVMEFIANAKPINHFAADGKLSLDDRLRLFVSVCDAVAHGHDRGIVHRDLKPGNILIDADGLPKVIDFGVARSTDSDFSLTSMKTDTGQLVGTVQYMSPEQFGDSPEGLDGRADVYSLGVVLYELVGGVLPYDVRKKKMHEAARIVCEHVPNTLRSLDRSVPRDVSLIVERCLEKNRRLRYQSAAALAADVRQYLAGETIPVSWRDRLRPLVNLWIGRNRARLLAVVGLTALVAALGLVSWGRLQGSASKVPGETPTVPVLSPPEIPPAVKDQLNEAMDSIGASGRSVADAVERAYEHVDKRSREIQADVCKRHIYTASAQMHIAADDYKKNLSSANLAVSKAYPGSDARASAECDAKWRQNLEALRKTLVQEFKALERQWLDLLAAAAVDPTKDSVKTAEQELKGRIDAWEKSYHGRFEALVKEASQEFLEVVRK